MPFDQPHGLIEKSRPSHDIVIPRGRNNTPNGVNDVPVEPTTTLSSTIIISLTKTEPAITAPAVTSVVSGAQGAVTAPPAILASIAGINNSVSGSLSDDSDKTTAEASDAGTESPTSTIKSQSPVTPIQASTLSVTSNTQASLVTANIPQTSAPAVVTPFSTISGSPNSPVLPTSTDPSTSSSGSPSSANAVPEQASHNSAVTPVVATIVPLTIITILALLFLCWRRRRSKSQREQDDLEKTAVWINKTNSDSPPAQKNKSRSDETYASSKRLKSPLFHIPTAKLPRRRHDMNGLALHPQPYDTPVPNKGQTGRLESSSLSPTSRAVFANLHDPDNGAAEFRASQIGLAVTTPSPAHVRNTSTSTMTSSIRTILHRASRRLSNPFRNSSVSTSNSEEASHQIRQTSQPTIHDDVVIDAYSQQQTDSDKDSTFSEATIRGDSRRPSNTPSDELARKWVQALHAEAAEAQVAAAEAAKKARELRRKHIVNG